MVELFRLGNDVFFLLSETLINLALLPLLLQQAHRLQRALALHDERPHARQILVGNLRFRVLAEVLVDSVEEIVDLALLVDVHAC